MIEVGMEGRRGRGSIHIGKEEVKWSLSTDNMKIDAENPMQSTEKLLESAAESSEASRYKVNV